MAPLLPLAVTIPRGGQDKRKPMFHLCCLGISNSKGSKRRKTAGCYIGGGRGNQVTLPFSIRFSLLASFAAVFKIRHLNKSVLMASRHGKKRHNLITVTVLFNELKASGSDLLFVYYFVVGRYMCDKMEQGEWENEPGCSYCGSRLWRYQSSWWFTPSTMCTWVFHPASPWECCSAMMERRVSETPWQVGRHKDSLLLIIDGNKLHSLDVWQGNTWRMWIQMCLWMCECVYGGKKKRWQEYRALSKRHGG